MEEKKNQFKPQRAKTGGRRKGVPNHTTAEHRKIISEFLSKNATPAQLKKMADQMEPKDRGAFYIKLWNFILPKLQSHEVGPSEGMTPEAAREIIEALLSEDEGKEDSK